MKDMHLRQDTSTHTADDSLRTLVEQINTAAGRLSPIDLGDGLVINGAYDMYKVLRHYDLPADLVGDGA